VKSHSKKRKVKKMLRENCSIRLAVDVPIKIDNALSQYMTKKGLKSKSEALRVLIKARLSDELGRVDLNGN